MTPERRTATLLAFAHAFERTAMDDAIDLFDALVSDIVQKARKDGEKERLRTLHDLDIAAVRLKDALIEQGRRLGADTEGQLIQQGLQEDHPAAMD